MRSNGKPRNSGEPVRGKSEQIIYDSSWEVNYESSSAEVNHSQHCQVVSLFLCLNRQLRFRKQPGFFFIVHCSH